MKQRMLPVAHLLFGVCLMVSCSNNAEQSPAPPAANPSPVQAKGQSGVQDSVSQHNVVQVAVASKDHSTLVKAIQTADLVDALANAGPFTVFAPTNAAFDQLPKGTLDDLLTPAKKTDLQNILQYHVSLGVFKPESFKDGQVLGQVNGDNITVQVKDGKITVNGKAHVLASVPAANGIVHVIDAVLLPPAKK